MTSCLLVENSWKSAVSQVDLSGIYISYLYLGIVLVSYVWNMTFIWEGNIDSGQVMY